MTAEQVVHPVLDGTSTLYFGPWYRRSPMFEATLRAGCTAFDIYNHMYLPAFYDDPVVEYHALNEGVTLWDVGVERTVEVSGPDADALVNLVTCRDLTRCAIGQGKYVIVTAPDGGIVNDPVLLHVGKDRWWLQLADSDAHLYLIGVLANSGLDAQVTLPDVHPVQVQGPQAIQTLRRLVGDSILDLRYYWCEHFTVGDIPVVISRTGWTAIPGFEINLLDSTRGTDLWNAIMGRELPQCVLACLDGRWPWLARTSTIRPAVSSNPDLRSFLAVLRAYFDVKTASYSCGLQPADISQHGSLAATRAGGSRT